MIDVVGICALLVIVIAIVIGVARTLAPAPKQVSARSVEADALLRELHIIDGLLNVLPAEFRSKLNKYLEVQQ